MNVRNTTEQLYESILAHEGRNLYFTMMVNSWTTTSSLNLVRTLSNKVLQTKLFKVAWNSLARKDKSRSCLKNEVRHVYYFTCKIDVAHPRNRKATFWLFTTLQLSIESDPLRKGHDIANRRGCPVLYPLRTWHHASAVRVCNNMKLENIPNFSKNPKYGMKNMGLNCSVAYRSVNVM